jgi:hypothetical protein
MYIFYNHNIFTHIFERKADQYFWWVVEERKNVCFGGCKGADGRL